MDVLPLQGPISAARHIHVDSCAIDQACFQVRGTLVTTRADYVDAEQVHCYQQIVVRLTLSHADLEILAADIAMPHEPFTNVCGRMPLGAAGLVGLRIRKGFSEELRRYSKEYIAPRCHVGEVAECRCDRSANSGSSSCSVRCVPGP